MLVLVLVLVLPLFLLLLPLPPMEILSRILLDDKDGDGERNSFGIAV